MAKDKSKVKREHATDRFFAGLGTEPEAWVDAFREAFQRRDMILVKSMLDNLSNPEPQAMPLRSIHDRKWLTEWFSRAIQAGRNEVLVAHSEVAPHPDDSLRNDLERLLNRHSAENGSNTPDFILAHFLVRMLHEFDRAVGLRDGWYLGDGKMHAPGGVEEQGK